MRRITLWFLSTLSALVLLLSYHTSLPGRASTSVVAEQVPSATPSTTTPSTTTPSTTTPDTTTPDSTTTPDTTTTDTTTTPSATTPTTLTGDAVQTRYGPVQVEITVAGDQITDVQILQVPWNDRRDQQINGYAVPVLIQETTDADSAAIDMVSGATFTSRAYVQSLQSALDQA